MTDFLRLIDVNAGGFRLKKRAREFDTQHKSRGSYAIKVGVYMPYKPVRVPLFSRRARDFHAIGSLILWLTIDTEIQAKRNNIISELSTFKITKAKAKVKFGAKCLCGHKCERSSVQLISLRKRKRNNIFRELISL